MAVMDIMNKIWSEASALYQERIPQATRDNLEEIRYAMIDDDNVMVANEFTSTLLNKLVKSVVITKVFENPLKTLKKGKKPLGDTIEEIYNNFIKGAEFDGSGNTTALIGRNLPDTKTCYHRMNFKMKYPVTYSREILAKAFSSWDALEKHINNLITTLYNSYELDEFLNMKQLIVSAVEANAMQFVETPDPLAGEAEAKEFIKTVKTVSGLMQFPSDDFNAYLDAQKVDTKPITTFTRKSEQVLIIDTATDVGVAVDVLASFNMSVAEFNDTRKIVIDHFPNNRIRAALVDEAFFQIYDDLFMVKSWENPESLYMNYWLHVWQTQAYSILVNAVLFVIPEG